MPRPRKQPPVPVADGHKFCFHCQTVKPQPDFAKDRSRWDGLRPMCRECDGVRQRAYWPGYYATERGPRERAATAAKAARQSLFSRMKADSAS